MRYSEREKDRERVIDRERDTACREESVRERKKGGQTERDFFLSD